jgi:hypothetical protein
MAKLLFEPPSGVGICGLFGPSGTEILNQNGPILLSSFNLEKSINHLKLSQWCRSIRIFLQNRPLTFLATSEETITGHPISAFFLGHKRALWDLVWRQSRLLRSWASFLAAALLFFFFFCGGGTRKSSITLSFRVLSNGRTLFCCMASVQFSCATLIHGKALYGNRRALELYRVNENASAWLPASHFSCKWHH